MTKFLILRLRNAAIAADRKGEFAMAELLTEAADELDSADKVVDVLVNMNQEQST